MTSSMEHIRDLPKGSDAIDIENGFEPTYEVSAEKKEIIAKLKKLAGEAEMVYLASDEVIKRQSGRKALIILSDGVDNASKVSLSSAIESAVGKFPIFQERP